MPARLRPPIISVTAVGLRTAAANLLLAFGFFFAAWPNIEHLEHGSADALWIGGAVLMCVVTVLRIPSRESRIDFPAFAATAAMLTMPCAILLANPSTGIMRWTGLGLEFCGVALAQTARIAMGRRFGVFPANRGIVSRGPFRLIRHPIYAGWILLSLGVALAYPGWRNFAIVLLTLPATLWRIRIEEQLLEQDPEYRAYKGRVHSMLIPRVL